MRTFTAFIILPAETTTPQRVLGVRKDVVADLETARQILEPLMVYFRYGIGRQLLIRKYSCTVVDVEAVEFNILAMCGLRCGLSYG